MMVTTVATHQMGSTTANAKLVSGVLEGRYQLRMIGEAEIVIATEIEQSLPRHQRLAPGRQLLGQTLTIALLLAPLGQRWRQIKWLGHPRLSCRPSGVCRVRTWQHGCSWRRNKAVALA